MMHRPQKAGITYRYENIFIEVTDYHERVRLMEKATKAAIAGNIDN
jgi:hypothetical protein